MNQYVIVGGGVAGLVTARRLAIAGESVTVLEAHVRDVVDRGRAAPSHVVNLGHGVNPETDPDVLTRIVELVHSL